MAHKYDLSNAKPMFKVPFYSTSRQFRQIFENFFFRLPSSLDHPDPKSIKFFKIPPPFDQICSTRVVDNPSKTRG